MPVAHNPAVIRTAEEADLPNKTAKKQRSLPARFDNVSDNAINSGVVLKIKAVNSAKLE